MATTTHLEHQAVLEKPLWRGVLHHWAAWFALGAGVLLVLVAPSPRAGVAAAVYALSLTLLLGVSATYHRLQWSPRAEVWMRRADHAAIFLLIAGTHTPVALLALDGSVGSSLLIAVWCGAAIGVLKSVFWVGAPRAITAALAVAVGWTVIPYFDGVRLALSTAQLWLIVVGGLAYLFGAVVYTVRRPDPWPRVFGYHEIFHGFTLVGAGLHFIAVFQIVRSSTG